MSRITKLCFVYIKIIHRFFPVWAALRENNRIFLYNMKWRVLSRALEKDSLMSPPHGHVVHGALNSAKQIGNGHFCIVLMLKLLDFVVLSCIINAGHLWKGLFSSSCWQASETTFIYSLNTMYSVEMLTVIHNGELFSQRESSSEGRAEESVSSTPNTSHWSLFASSLRPRQLTSLSITTLNVSVWNLLFPSNKASFSALPPSGL